MLLDLISTSYYLPYLALNRSSVADVVSRGRRRMTLERTFTFPLVRAKRVDDDGPLSRSLLQTLKHPRLLRTYPLETS